MTRLRSFALLSATAFALTACGMSESIDSDSPDGIFTITHTTKGSLYWE